MASAEPATRRRERLCAADEIRPGSMRSFSVRGITVVVVRTGAGDFYALNGRCAHQGAPLGAGVLTGRTEGTPGAYTVERPGEVLRCPWHGFDYDVTTGRCLSDPDRLRVRGYRVSVEDGDLYLD